ncbi:TPA: hypothetical protein ACYYHR_001073 [Salmonella enterica subsp. diarizonae serovar 48:i:z]|nr:hypothetical protein [Salmonella enterica]EAU4681830.1 hypothetical protein [Salmonella enterica]ECI9305902.1 hypothetical protein [Salmonella enterica]EEL1931216.1 hypothetical protein [Salmonella enterica subsp. diarizonae]EGB8645960.1 hypothetical protein [Salmonella enterica]
MAVLRSLTTTLGLNAASFRSELKRSQQSMKEFSSSAKDVGVALAKGFGKISGVTALIGGLGAVMGSVSAVGLVSEIRKTYRALDDVIGTANNLGVIPRRFDEMRRAAQWSGVSMNDLSDSMRDLNTQITRVAQSGKGPLADFFTKINQKASDWAKLAPDQQLSKFSEELHKLPDNQVLYWLNRVNGSLAKMKDPLMTGELAKSREEIEKLGLALSGGQFDNIHKARVEFEKMESLASGLWEHVQAAAAPAISQVLQGINDWITKTAEAHGGFRKLGRDIALFILDGVKKASDAIYQFVDGIGQNIKRSQLNYGWGGVSQKDREQYAELVDLTRKVKEARKTLIDEYQHNGGHEVYDGQLSQIARLTQLQDKLNGKMKEMLSFDGQGDFYQSLTAGFNKARQTIVNAGSGDNEGDSSGSSGKPPLGAPPIIDIRKMKGAVGEFSRLRQQVEQDNADSLQRLVLQEQDARQKIIISGREAGKSQSEIDKVVAENAELYARKRQELAEQYAPAKQLRRQYADVSTLLAEFRQGDRLNEKEYQDALGKLRADSFQKMAELYADGTITTQQKMLANVDPLVAIENQYQRELALLEYYKQKEVLVGDRYDQLRAEKIQARSEAISQYRNRDARKQLQTQQQLFEGMAGLVQGFAGKSTGAYRALFSISKAFHLADVIMASQDAIAKAWSSAPFPANLAAVAATAAKTGLLTAAVQSVTMQGMAHDGIDSVPREGTWLLDRGERVVDRRTNADLKTYLAKKQEGSRVNSVVVNSNSSLTVNNNGRDKDDEAMDFAAMANNFGDRLTSRIKETVIDMMRDGGELSR